MSRRYPLRYSIERKFALVPMCSRPQSALGNTASLRLRILAPILVLLAALLICPQLSRGQETPAGAIGRVEGNDVSVDNGTTADSAPTAATPGAPSFVFNGSVLTVHDGKARLMLVAGGQVDICGPAKFTLLQSGAVHHTGAELRPSSFAASGEHSAANLYADNDCDAAGHWRSEPRNYRGLGHERFVVRAGKQRRHSAGAAIHRRGTDRSAERRILPVRWKSGSGRGHARKLRLHADACASIAATEDSGDGRDVARPVERRTISVGTNTSARGEPCTESCAADCGRCERT